MTATGPSTTTKGVAGRIDYDSWQKRTSDLTKQLEDEEETERQQNASALGLDGKHARSAAEAEERAKAKELERTKTMLEKYQRREEGVVENLMGLLGPVSSEEGENNNATTNAEEKHQEVKYVTRDMLSAGKRVITLSDTRGPGKIVLTQDLSNLQSATPANAALQPKSYSDDAENKEQMPQPTIHRGLIKLNLRNLHSCTVVIKCKLITGTVEISHCADVTVVAEGDDATVVTVQADLCTGLHVQFRDSPSGKNVPRPVRDTNSGPTTTLFWGGDGNDRIYHAGVSDLKVSTYRDGYLDMETTADYVKDGAKAVGNASAEEVQFVTSVVDGELVTEKVLSAGETRGMKQGAHPMTERELKVLEKKKSQIEEALDERLKDLVQIKDGNGDKVISSGSAKSAKEEDVVKEVYASATKEEIDAIVASIEEQKAKGNEAFTSGEYAQAVLFYTLALDRAADLPDATAAKERLSSGKSSSSAETLEQLFPRHIVLSNRSACFLKLGHHEKALADGSDAQLLEPTYVKGTFRKGLALHAMGRYREAIDALAAAQKLEPKNKQIKQALQFAEVRMTEEMRKRMDR
mmetsp:Transcript_40420/g.68930  ORF Transcript_40420/g.68930 Transcript_40420/m.68930 type:complete len:579 (+) Transcript_40420:43-1779(+)